MMWLNFGETAYGITEINSPRSYDDDEDDDIAYYILSDDRILELGKKNSIL